jgi:hypothetical protein
MERVDNNVARERARQTMASTKIRYKAEAAGDLGSSRARRE